MRKFAIISLLLIIIFCLFLIKTDPIVKNIQFEQGGIDVLFCPKENCEQELFNFLNSSNQEILCALFDLDLLSIINLLEEKNRVQEIKILVDVRNKRETENLSFVKIIDKSGLMHNKFCVVDGKKIFTGSFNPTLRGAHKNNNNALFIESKTLAKNYKNVFFKIYNNSVYNTQKNLIINNSFVKNYFCPMDNCISKVSKELSMAKKSIHFLTFSFTSREIANNLLIKYHENITIKGVFEKTQISKYSQYHILDYQGVDVSYDGNKYNMHNKVFIIDNETVITGSFNPSNNADKNNDENILIIKNKAIAERFLNEFNGLYS